MVFLFGSLGENPFIQELFLKHLAQSIRMIERKQQAHQQAKTESVNRSSMAV